MKQEIVKTRVVPGNTGDRFNSTSSFHRLCERHAGGLNPESVSLTEQTGDYDEATEGVKD